NAPGAPPPGGSESASHLPTPWMCMPWKPGVRMPALVVCTVMVAYSLPPSLVNSKVAVATWPPSGVARCATRLSVSLAPPGSLAAPDGAADPVQMAGVVPGASDGCSLGGLHAADSTTGVAKRTAARALR